MRAPGQDRRFGDHRGKDLDSGRRERLGPGPTQKENTRMRWVLRSKIHKATVTEADVNYVGSVTIDEDLMDRVGLWPGEKVLIVDNTNGARIETYTIAGQRGSGAVEINGAAAHRVNRGDEVIIMGFELSSVPLKPKAILVDERNQFVRDLIEEPSTVIPA